MKNILIVALLILPAGAEAQVINLLNCTSQNSLSSVSPGATCTYGGIAQTCQPLVGSATTTNFCFPGNTGPQGPTGATGATGAAGSNGTSVTSSSESPGTNCVAGGSRFVSASGTTYACNGQDGATGSQGATGATGTQGEPGIGVAFVDDGAFDVPEVVRFDSKAHWWDGETFFPISTADGSFAIAYNTGDMVAYEDSGCTGVPFWRVEDGFMNVARAAKDYDGTGRAWHNGSGVTHSGPCYGYNGGSTSCVTISCPSTPHARAILSPYEPDVSAVQFPLHAIKAN